MSTSGCMYGINFLPCSSSHIIIWFDRYLIASVSCSYLLQLHLSLLGMSGSFMYEIKCIKMLATLELMREWVQMVFQVSWFLTLNYSHWFVEMDEVTLIISFNFQQNHSGVWKQLYPRNFLSQNGQSFVTILIKLVLLKVQACHDIFLLSDHFVFHSCIYYVNDIAIIN
jgi:hypothetical protein